MLHTHTRLRETRVWGTRLQHEKEILVFEDHTAACHTMMEEVVECLPSPWAVAAWGRVLVP